MTEEKKKEIADSAEGLMEAPASASVKIKSPKGFEYIFTLRDMKASNLMYKIAAMEDKWQSEGFTPVAQQSGFSRQPAVSKPCPIHQLPMTEKLSKKTGKPYYSHSQGVYPNLDTCFGKGYSSQMQQQTGQTNYPERQVNEDF